MAEAEDIVQSALADWETTKLGWSEVYEKARDDLNFLSDDEFAQWDKTLLDDRKNRPIYTIDQLGQFIHQVSNDIRMNTPTIKVIPDGEGVDIKTAETLQGIIRGIEYKSNADAAYDTAVDFSIKSSLGFIRVDHDYIDDEGFEQELLIKRVVNPQAVYIDPSSIEPDGSDAMFGFVFEEMTVKEFNKKYPDKTPSSFGEIKPNKAPNDQDRITIAEYFRIVDEKVTKGMTQDGEIEDYNDKKDYKSKREVTKRKVYRYKLSGEDELEKTTFPGKYIPIVPVYGEEAWIEGKRNLFSLIRKSKSSQRLFNLGISLDVEILMKQPQASFMAAAGQVSGFEHEYADPAKANVLHYNQLDVNGNPAGAPQRVMQPQSSMGFVNMSREAVDNIKATMGLYNASIGNRSNETSGIAIQRRQQEGDVATFHFGDNLVRSITHVGKIIVCAKDEIYDTPRVVKMVDEEDNYKMVGINGKRVLDQEQDYNIKEGNYDVRVVTGASYTTQRQEAAAFYSQLITAMPDLMPVIGDLVFKYQDSAGAPAISNRLKKLVDPKLLDESEKDKTAVDPQIEALSAQLQQITAEAQAQIQALQAELANKQADTASKMADIQLKTKELELKEGDQQIKARSEMVKAENDRAKLLLEEKKLELEQMKTANEIHNSQNIQNPQTSPVEIKLDTNGFQIMKTPEQLAFEQQQHQDNSTMEMSKQQAEMLERQSKQEQSMALLQSIGGIQDLLGALVQQTGAQTQAITQQTQAITQPIQVVRDENGMITGAV